MTISGIIQEKCNKCGICIKECPAGLFSLNDNKIIFSDPGKWCILCSHCAASCPNNAVKIISDDQPEEFENNSMISFDQMKKLLLSKRSVRNYIDRDVPDEAIVKFLEIARFAPSGHNYQPCEYLIIKNTDVLKILADEIIKSLKKFKKIMRIHIFLKPFVSKNLYKIMSDKSSFLAITEMIKQYESGKDTVFFSAPAVIIAHVPDIGALSFVDPSISFTYGMLALHTLGIASCWMGLALMLGKNKKVYKSLNLTLDRKIGAAITIGYPAVKYHRTPVRNKIKAEWIK